MHGVDKFESCCASTFLMQMDPSSLTASWEMVLRLPVM